VDEDQNVDGERLRPLDIARLSSGLGLLELIHPVSAIRPPV
jgi:hypothetical protein